MLNTNWTRVTKPSSAVIQQTSKRYNVKVSRPPILCHQADDHYGTLIKDNQMLIYTRHSQKYPISVYRRNCSSTTGEWWPMDPQDHSQLWEWWSPWLKLQDSGYKTGQTIMRLRRHMKPTPIPAKEYPQKEITKTSASQVAEKSDELFDIWMAIHDSHDPTRPDIEKYNEKPMRYNIITDNNTCTQSGTGLIYTKCRRVHPREWTHAWKQEIITENNLQPIMWHWRQ